jgi:hypothetical protein
MWIPLVCMRADVGGVTCICCFSACACRHVTAHLFRVRHSRSMDCFDFACTSKQLFVLVCVCHP